MVYKKPKKEEIFASPEERAGKEEEEKKEESKPSEKPEEKGEAKKELPKEEIPKKRVDTQPSFC